MTKRVHTAGKKSKRRRRGEVIPFPPMRKALQAYRMGMAGPDHLDKAPTREQQWTAITFIDEALRGYWRLLGADRVEELIIARRIVIAAAIVPVIDLREYAASGRIVEFTGWEMGPDFKPPPRLEKVYPPHHRRTRSEERIAFAAQYGLDALRGLEATDGAEGGAHG